MNQEKMKISALDLEDIKAKLMHEDSGMGWSMEHVDQVEIEYRRFLYLMKKFPNEETSPSVEVDTFWHYHILDTMKYAADCQQVFGYFLHHYPYVGMGGGERARHTRERAGARMRELYAQTFGASKAHDPESLEAAGAEDAVMAYCGVAAKPAYCGAGSADDAHRSDAGNAYCGVAAQDSYCGVTGAKRPNRRASNSYCGATVRSIYRGPATPRPSVAAAGRARAAKWSGG